MLFDWCLLLIKGKNKESGNSTSSRGERQRNPGHQSKEAITVLHRNALLSSYKKYYQYMKQLPYIDEVYKKYDKDHDGYLSGKELLSELYMSAICIIRPVHVMVWYSILLYYNMKNITKNIDADCDAKIGRHELLPALDAWDDLAAKKLMGKPKLTNNTECCTIL